MQPESLNITELSGLYGVSLRTPRFYEQKGLLNPTRVGTIRVYRTRDCIALELIIKGKRLGFSLSEVERLIEKAPMEPALQLSKEQIVGQLKFLQEQREDVGRAIAELKGVLDALPPIWPK